MNGDSLSRGHILLQEHIELSPNNLQSFLPSVSPYDHYRRLGAGTVEGALEKVFKLVHHAVTEEIALGRVI